jgi:hypothetical protein
MTERRNRFSSTRAALSTGGRAKTKFLLIEPHYPVCQSPMRVIAVIDDPRAVEKILRHLGAWHDPPAGLSPPGDEGSYTYEPPDDADPTPDYENALTD